MKIKPILKAGFYIIIFGFMFAGCRTEPKQTEVGQKMDKNTRVVMIIATKNFRDEEYLEPKKVFINLGVKVVTASSNMNEAVGMLGARVMPDMIINDINVDDYDAIIFVGGGGASEYFENFVAHKIAKEAVNKNKVLGAICIAPATLANAGVLKGRNATAFSSVKHTLTKNGATYTGRETEVDGNIVTASGPQAATDFGETIVKLLSK